MLPIGYPIPEPYHLHAMVLALLCACMGWVLYRFGVRIAGFSVGFLLGSSLGALVPAVFHHPEAQIWTVPLLGILLGWVSAMLVVGLLRMVIFLSVALVAFFALSVLTDTPLTMEAARATPAAYFVLLGVSMILGIVGVVLQRYLIIVLTVWIGASLMAAILPHPATFPAMAALGLFVQLGLYRRMIPHGAEGK